MTSNRPLKVFEVASSAVFLVLVVLAWGSWRPFFASPPRTGVIVIGGLATVAALFTDASVSPGKREDVANRWVGTTLRMWPVFVLGHRFSGLVAIQENHSLVTTGPYRRVRHPSYLGMLLFVVGWGFVFRTPVGIVLAGLFLIPLIARMDSEERMLASEFGASYEDYRRHTSRLIPGVY